MSFDIHAYSKELVQSLRTHSNLLSLQGPLDTVIITPLGIGESNIVFRVMLNEQQSFTLRIAYRADTEKNLAKEFALLQQVPEGFGPRPFYLDMSKQYLPHPFAILSFVPGAVSADWSDQQLQMHGTKLAHLHQHQATYWHEKGGQKTSRPFNIHQDFSDGLAHCRTMYPQVFEIDVISLLVPQLDTYFRSHNELFTSLSSFSLIHGDPCVPNILFAQDDIHYIDWEYARFGDGALDVAQLGWDIANPPWQMELVGERLDLFLQAYQTHRFDPMLSERRAVWVTYLKFFDHIHYRAKAQGFGLDINDVSRSHYSTAVQRITESLAAQFL